MFFTQSISLAPLFIYQLHTMRYSLLYEKKVFFLGIFFAASHAIHGWLPKNSMEKKFRYLFKSYRTWTFNSTHKKKSTSIRQLHKTSRWWFATDQIEILSLLWWWCHHRCCRDTIHNFALTAWPRHRFRLWIFQILYQLKLLRIQEIFERQTNADKECTLV